MSDERMSASLQAQNIARAELRHALEEMEFAAFERIIKSLLYRSGYVSVQLIGRNYKRGRTPKGGLDMTARSVTELSSALTIAQVKQYKRVVSRRFVDELRGAMLRIGAGQGLLLTMSKFSKVAHEAAKDSPVAPITLIEGEEILDLLFAYRIGIVLQDRIWRLDEKYLDFVQERSMSTDEMNTHATNTQKPNNQESEVR